LGEGKKIKPFVIYVGVLRLCSLYKMRERSCGFSSEVDDDLYKDKKKPKTSASCSCDDVETPMEETPDYEFEGLWVKLVLQLQRVLQLKTVEAISIAE
jgi:hypothetical protein